MLRLACLGNRLRACDTVLTLILISLFPVLGPHLIQLLVVEARSIFGFFGGLVGDVGKIWCTVSDSCFLGFLNDLGDETFLTEISGKIAHG